MHTRKTLLKLLEAKEAPMLKYWTGQSVQWAAHKIFARATAKIAFGCDIRPDPNGVVTCKNRRDLEGYACRYPHSTTERVEMACCVGCASALGYLDTIPPGSARRYVRYWSKATGFWRKGKGCLLPRTMRSVTCLRYNCSDEASKAVHTVLVQIGIKP